MPYSAYKKIAIGSLVLYFIAACLIQIVSPLQQNIYPFFTWNLFSHIPNTGHSFTMEVLSYDGTVYDPPLTAGASLFLFQNIEQTPIYYVYLTADIGNAIRDGRDTAAIRKKLEAIFRNKPAQYSIVEITYDPISYWKTGAVLSKKTLGTFTVHTL